MDPAPGAREGPTKNPVMEAIRSRRNTKKLRAEPAPSREQVEAVIEAATWAPNHHLTEPWRFIVIVGDERQRLGDALAEALLSTVPETSAERLEFERAKPRDAPVIITMISSPLKDPKVVQQEELIAAGAGLQNMLLAAQSLGLASMIRTGPHSFSGRMRDYFGMKEGESLVGMVYLGYPLEGANAGKRSDHRGKTSWRGTPSSQ